MSRRPTAAGRRSSPRAIGPVGRPTASKSSTASTRKTPRPQLHAIDMRTKRSVPIGIGFYGAQWSSDGKSVYCNGLMPQLDLSLGRFPARLWIDRSKIEFFALDKDVPFSPCVSRDGKTLVLIVDSDGPAKSPEEQKKEAEAEAAEKEHPEIP